MSEVTATFKRAEIIEHMKHDLDFFAQVCLPDVYRYPFPPIHKAVWQMLTEGAATDTGISQLAFGLPRGFAKTVLLKLFAVHSILFSTRQFIVTCCNTASLAENFLADVLDVLASENIRRLFGDYRAHSEISRQELQKFTFMGRAIILCAVGAGTSVRGINIKYLRPDILICDDMQSREEADSPIESAKLLNWFQGTLLKFVSPHRSLRVFLGNMYPSDGCILKKLKYNPVWTTFITGAILEDGDSIWPEHKSVEALLDELASDTAMGTPEIFYAEVMNDEEAGSRSGCDITKIIPQELPGTEPEAACIIIDPSAGKKKSDDLVIGAFKIYDQLPYLTELAIGKFNPAETIKQTLQLAMRLQIRAIFIESVAYQSTLAFWFQHYCNEWGVEGINVYEIYPRGAKNSRIITALKDLQAGKILTTQSTRNKVVNQITQFDPLKTTNKDDILDVVAYIYPTMSEHLPAMECIVWQEASTVPASHSDDLLLGF